MKTYDEMAKYVLEVRDEHEKKRKRRIYIAKRAVPALAGVLGAFIIGFGLWNNYRRPDMLPTPSTVVESETTAIASTAQTTPKTMTTSVTASAVTSKTDANTTTSTTAAASSTAVYVTTKAATTAAKPETTATQIISKPAAETISSTTPRITSTTTVTQTVTTTTTDPEMTGGPPAKSTQPPGGGTPPGSAHNPWYDMPVNKQYYNAFLEGYVADLTPAYRSGYPISSELIGKHISSANMKSQYYVDGEVKSCKAEAYFINGFSDDDIVAIKFDGHDEYYLYHTDKTDLYSLMKIIPPLET